MWRTAVLPTERDQVALRHGLRLQWLAVAIAAILTIAPGLESPAVPGVLGAPGGEEGWVSNSTYSLRFLGRDGPDGSDHYHVTLDWGASFFAIATDAMPLLPPPQAVDLLIRGFKATHPDRTPESIQPEDSFDFYVPAGTLVCAEWRDLGGRTTEYRSLRGDFLVVYNSYGSPLLYRLSRVEDPGAVEVMINQEADLRALDLARALYGQEDPGFTPDLLQVAQARKALQENTATVTVDRTRTHMDDFWDLKGNGEAGGATEEGLDIYWFRSPAVAQPLFRVDDGIRDGTDAALFTSPMRVYYYKDGVVRTWVRTGDIAFLSGRQPRNDVWAKIYADYGRVNPVPNRWDLGQPEQDAGAQDLARLGITVLRFQPKEPPRGNFFTHLLDLLMGLMQRKES